MKLDELFELATNAPTYKRWNMFWNRVIVKDIYVCWEWQGCRSLEKNGERSYGLTRYRGKNQRTHRLICTWLYGELPKWLHVDHRWCSNPPCVNPFHLIPTTAMINTLRPGSQTLAAINQAKTHCKNGHEFTPENTYYFPAHPDRRTCRTCHLSWKRDRYQRGLDNGTARYNRPKIAGSWNRLKIEQAKEIHANWNESARTLAARYGVTQQTINRIRQAKDKWIILKEQGI